MSCPVCHSEAVMKLGEEPRGDIVQCLNCGADGVRPVKSVEPVQKRCRQCDGVIPVERLEVLPDAELCMPCASRGPEHTTQASGEWHAPWYQNFYKTPEREK